MQGKMAKSAPQPAFGLAGGPMAIRTSCLKITVSVVRFRPWHHLASADVRKRSPAKTNR